MKKSGIARLYLASFFLPLLFAIVGSIIMIFVAPQYQMDMYDAYDLDELYILIPTLATALLSATILLNGWKSISENPYNFHITWLLIPCLIPSLLIGGVIGSYSAIPNHLLAERFEYLIMLISAILNLVCIFYTFRKFQLQSEKGE